MARFLRSGSSPDFFCSAPPQGASKCRRFPAQHGTRALRSRGRGYRCPSIYDQPTPPGYDRTLSQTEIASCQSGESGQAESDDHINSRDHERHPLGLLQDCGMSSKLRIVVLVREGLVPPETIDGLSEAEIQPWKTEYDVISTL